MLRCLSDSSKVFVASIFLFTARFYAVHCHVSWFILPKNSALNICWIFCCFWLLCLVFIMHLLQFKIERISVSHFQSSLKNRPIYFIFSIFCPCHSQIFTRIFLFFTFLMHSVIWLPVLLSRFRVSPCKFPFCLPAVNTVSSKYIILLRWRQPIINHGSVTIFFSADSILRLKKSG